MKIYNLKIEPEAISDIQEITDWYNEQQAGLGKRFKETVIQQINSLNKDPQIYAVRYNDIHCIGLNKFPYMAHFYINDKSNTVEVLSVISTSRNPKIWREKTSKQ